MICRQCGAEVPEGQPVCPYCGTKMMLHLSDNDIERLANTFNASEDLPGAHFATRPIEDTDPYGVPSVEANAVIPPDITAPVGIGAPANVTAPANSAASTNITAPANSAAPTDVAMPTNIAAPANLAALSVEANPLGLNNQPVDTQDIPSVFEQPSFPAEEPEEEASTVIYGSENTSDENYSSVASPIEASPERRRLERMVRRAKRRSWIQAARCGIEQQDRPHIHVHDNNQSLSAFRLSEPEEHQSWLRRKRIVAGVVACVFVVLLGIGIAFGTWQAELWGGHTIDDVRGMTSTDATARLVADGFQVVLAEEPSENSVGLVVSMSPSPGERADEGTTVTIYVGVDESTTTASAG